MDSYLPAVYLLFNASIVVSNIIFAVVVIRGRLVKQRGFLLLLNFAVADLILAIWLLVQNLRLLGLIYLSIDYLVALYVLSGNLLPSVVQVNLVLVNVSYVLETRKERVNGSRLVTALMVASPWLYTLLVVAPFVNSTTFGLAGLFEDGLSSYAKMIQQLISNIIPGLFACIATTLAVVSYVTRDRQEGNDSAIKVRDATPIYTIPPPQSGSDLEDPPVMTSPAEAPAAKLDDVTAEPRSPKAEVVYTAVSVTLGVVAAIAGFYDDAVAIKICVMLFAILPRPAVFSWLWLLRPDVKQTFKRVLCCGSQAQPYSNF